MDKFLATLEFSNRVKLNLLSFCGVVVNFRRAFVGAFSGVDPSCCVSFLNRGMSKLRQRPDFLTKKDKSVSSTIRVSSGGLKMAWLICGLRGIHRYIDCCEICDLRCAAIDKSVSSTNRILQWLLEDGVADLWSTWHPSIY